MKQAKPLVFRIPPDRWLRWSGLVILVAMAAGIGYYVRDQSKIERTPSSAIGDTSTPADRARNGQTVEIEESRWESLGIQVAPTRRADFIERLWRTGRLTLNETRIAHISPMVEGVVREVKVQLGQDVKAGEVLAIIDCREVGQAKLELVKSRLALEYAGAQHRWTQNASRHAAELVEAVLAGMSVGDIEKKFRDRPIGDLRQQLVTAYSRRLQAKAHYESVIGASVQGAISQANVIRMRADYEAAEAVLQALCEEVRFQTGQQLRTTEQKLREAQTAESLSKASLMMLGFTREEVARMDPLAEGAEVSRYPIRAPFSGTIIEQHAVLAERVGPQTQMFEIADMSNLWLQADVPQKDVPTARQLTDAKLRFRVSEGGQSLHEADVFYTGDVVNRETRAVLLSATVKNPDRAFKPGMFVEVELTRVGGAVVQIPVGAVQRQGTQAFVFVHEGGAAFRRVDVILGRTSAGAVEVLEGLREGQPVVIAGGFILKSELLKDQMAGD